MYSDAIRNAWDFISDRTWIGAYDQFNDDVMFWLDGSAVNQGYTNWLKGQPDGGNHDCLYLKYDENWQWADFPRRSKFYALCEI